MENRQSDKEEHENALKEIVEKMKEPKGNRVEELIAESRILGILKRVFEVPDDLLEIVPIFPTIIPGQEPTDFFSTLLPDGTVLDTHQNKITEIAERVSKALNLTTNTFRSKKVPQRVLIEKFSSIQKNTAFTNKSMLANLLIDIDVLARKIEGVLNSQGMNFQDNIKLSEDINNERRILFRKRNTLDAYMAAKDHPDTLETIKEHTTQRIPIIKKEIEDAIKRIEQYKQDRTNRDIEFTNNNNLLFSLREQLFEKLKQKPISIWPRKIKPKKGYKS